MANLSGLQIQKLLPKTNCKECGSNTCLAFAMKLAARKADLNACPYVSEEAKAVLGAAAEPPVRTVTLGVGHGTFTAGGETVMFRHEKTFVNATGLGVALHDSMEASEVDRRVKALHEYRVVRVGEELRVNLVSVAHTSGSLERFLDTITRVAAQWEWAIAVRSESPAALSAAAEALRGRRPLLASATSETVKELGEVAKAHDAVLGVSADTIDELVAVMETLRAIDVKDAFLELRADSLCEHLQNSTIMRRAALKSGVKAFGYPTIKYIDTGNAMDDAVEAGIEISKYGGLAILPAFDPAVFASLLALRQNIFTDPQKPIQVEPKLYPIGEPDESSPVFVTTNFSLTYFIVSGEIENAGLSAWLLVPECEGMSVLTAWAAGKFGGDKVGAFAKEIGLDATLKSRKIVIPGYVAQISGELEEAMPGWDVIVGPQEAGDLESFIKNVFAA